MLEIEYRGGNCWTLDTKRALFVFDANRKRSGLKNLSDKRAIQIATEHDLLADEKDFHLSFCGEGEYEIAGTEINGFAVARRIDDPREGKKRSTLYNISTDDIKIGVFGNIMDNLGEQDLENLGMVDVLILPVGGGGYTLDGVAATKLISKIEPKIVIPIHFAQRGLNYEVPGDDLSAFLKELKATVVEEKKLKLKSPNDIPPVMQIRHLELAI
ncbi:MBL fold metallo-hydrolase [Candidatus Saccharibacteria bacterium]|nr:MBL fold metallo-hydrolase [Candidatus Saccharibacteria bacterium]